MIEIYKNSIQNDFHRVPNQYSLKYPNTWSNFEIPFPPKTNPALLRWSIIKIRGASGAGRQGGTEFFNSR